MIFHCAGVEMHIEKCSAVQQNRSVYFLLTADYLHVDQSCEVARFF